MTSWIRLVLSSYFRTIILQLYSALWWASRVFEVGWFEFELDLAATELGPLTVLISPLTNR